MRVVGPAKEKPWWKRFYDARFNNHAVGTEVSNYRSFEDKPTKESLCIADGSVRIQN